jgi:hypothetical protein
MESWLGLLGDLADDLVGRLAGDLIKWLFVMWIENKQRKIDVVLGHISNEVIDSNLDLVLCIWKN